MTISQLVMMLDPDIGRPEARALGKGRGEGGRADWPHDPWLAPKVGYFDTPEVDPQHPGSIPGRVIQFPALGPGEGRVFWGSHGFLP